MAKTPVWGLGGPKLVSPATRGKFERVVGFFDMHFHHNEEDLWERAMKALEDIKPHRVVFGGDLADNSLISRWEEKKRLKMPQGKVNRIVMSDLDDISKQSFGRVREILPNCVIDFTEGNHDERARLWLDDELEKGVAEFKEAMNFGDYDVNWHPRSGFRLRPEFIIRHGHYTTKHNALREHESTKCGGWSGHKHSWTEWDETHHETDRRWHWTVAPIMGRVDFDYGPGQSGKAPWPQGFLVGTFSTEDQYLYHTDVATYWRDKLLLRGKVY